VHETPEEAMEETMQMLDVYARFAADYLAIPVIKGEKTEGEKFPGAVNTYSIEAMMQDKKALQSGTSHFLGQNFARSSNIRYQNREGEFDFAWTTSWGVSTRLIGALIMAHSDDNGLVLPPKIAPAHQVQDMFKGTWFEDVHLYTELDDRELTGGERNWHWIKKGIPLRMEIGPRDVASGKVMIARRDKGHRDKEAVELAEVKDYVLKTLAEIQANIYAKALKFQQDNTINIDDTKEFYKFFTPKNEDQPEIHGGFALSHFCGDEACEEKIKDDLKVTVRCIPFDVAEEDGTCISCGKASQRRVVFAKSY
jgi:prolyl-tRNA synthetase